MMRPQTVKNAAWKALRHYATAGDMKCLQMLLPRQMMPTRDAVDAYLRELTESPELLGAIATPDSRRYHATMPATMTARDLLGMRLAMHATGKGRAVLLYVVARVLKPRVVIETGCFSGWDSAVLLQALDRNGAGHLWSIDLPAKVGQFSQVDPRSGLPDGVATGFLVPPSLTGRWTLIEGNVRDELPPLLREIAPVDLFLHDSDHSYAHMMWEFATVLPHMAPTGVMVADDIAWNTSFWDFSSAMGRPFVIHRTNPNVGALSIAGGER